MNSVEELPVATEVGNYFISNYPPYSRWQGRQIEDFEASLATPVGETPLGLYVHLPFCRQRCAYCYFRVRTNPVGDEVDAYIRAIASEARMYRERPAIGDRPIMNAYFGGGTPTLLSDLQIETLFARLRSALNWTDDAANEVTFECQPGTVSLEKLRRLAGLGVNRASIGFQTLTDAVLRFVGRAASRQECFQAYELARQAGFDQVNVDLMAGLPNETEATWRETIDRLVELQPDCVTIYQFELAHNSVLKRMLSRGRELVLPDWPTKRRWVDWAFDRLQEHGYTIIGAYWAVRDPVRHRYAYVTEHFWRGRDLLALGETSFGIVQGFHYQNADECQSYLDAIEAGRLPLQRAYRLSEEEALRREAILQLKTGTLQLGYFRDKFHVDLRVLLAGPLESLRKAGLLVIDDEAVRLARQGLLRIDWLLPLFYLPEHVGGRYT